jgi:hypothetical protein
MQKVLSFFVILFAFVSNFLVSAQVTIGILEPPRATLDVVSVPDSKTADGIIAPRVSLNKLNDNENKYSGDQKGALVYVDIIDDVPKGKTVNVKTIGYYFFDGSVWNAIGAIEPWNESGTADPARLNTQDIYTLGKVGIGTTSPSAGLDIDVGNASGTGFKLRDGSQNQGRVLTCDANGNASWDDNRLHVIKGTTNDDNIEYTIPTYSTTNYQKAYVENSSQEKMYYYQSQAAVTSNNNYITLPPGVWKIEFSFPIIVETDFVNSESDWLEGLVFFTENANATSYSQKYTDTHGVAIPHLVQCRSGYIERGYGWSFIKNAGNTPVTLYMAFGRLNLNYRSAANENNWFGKKIVILPAGRTPYLYATEVGKNFQF